MASLQEDWKQALFRYVNAVNEAALRGEESLLQEVADPVHRNRLAARLRETVRREDSLGAKPARSETRARIENVGTVGTREVSVDVALHSVKKHEQLGLTWQEERVDRERIRFIGSDRGWKLDSVDPLAAEGLRRSRLFPPDDDPEGLFERRDAMPSVPLIRTQPTGQGAKSQVYAGPGADGSYGGGMYRRGIPYRRDAAVAYAERWWNETNPAYEPFEVNCTNYVSQCVFAGQAPMNYTGRRESGWWYKGRANGRELWSYSWAVADSLQRYLSHPRSFGLRAEALPSPDGLQLGDVICYDWDGTGRFGHNTIVTAFAPDGSPLVNANTVSSRHRLWDYRDSYAWTGRTRYRFFHIADEF